MAKKTKENLQKYVEKRSLQRKISEQIKENRKKK